MSKKHEIHLPGDGLGNGFVGKMPSKPPRCKKEIEGSRS
jgi:hypothetical protein